MTPKTMNESRCVKHHLVLPADTNNYGTFYGGELMKLLDNIAATTAMRHSQRAVVTASTDSVDFLHPISAGSAVLIETFVSYTGRTSIEVFCKVITEDLVTGERHVAATSFLTFVALDENGKPVPVPPIIPETEEEKILFQTGPERAKMRKERRLESQKWANNLVIKLPWEK